MKNGVILPSGGQGKRLVLVVHGIGDEEPGAAVESLARSIRATTKDLPQELSSSSEILWLPKEDQGRLLEQFPCRIERTRTASTETVLAEASWADLSHVPRTLLGTLRGLLDLIFGLGHIARHAARPTKQSSTVFRYSAKLLEGLCKAVAWLLSGPVMAVTATWLIGWAILLGASNLDVSSDAFDARELVTFAAFVAGFLSIAIGGLGCLRRRGDPWDHFFFSLVLIGVIGIFFFYVWHTEGALKGFTARQLLDFVDMLRHVPSFLVIVTLAVAWLAWFVASAFSARTDRPRLALALATSVLAAALLTLVINLVFVWAMQPYESLYEAEEAAAIVVGTPEQVPLIEQGDGQPEAKQSPRDYLDEYRLPRMSVYWVAGLGLAFMFVVPVVKRSRWIRSAAAEEYDPRRPIPRLVLSPWAVGFLVVMGIAVPVSTIVPGFDWLYNVLAMGNTLFTGASILLVAAVASFLIEPLRQGIDLGRDIVARFEAEEARGKLAFPTWERIQARFRRVLRSVLAKEKPDRLTIVAHSQGTIVAIEALLRPEAADLLSPLESCDLVTLGCPFDHLYQHYFAADYPPLDDEHWKGLRTRARRWVNIFRVDDFVGTHVEPRGGWPDGQRVGAGVDTWPENRPVSPAGHTGYWIDPEVTKILCDEKLV